MRETVRAALKELLGENLVDRRHGYGTFPVVRATCGLRTEARIACSG